MFHTEDKLILSTVNNRTKCLDCLVYKYIHFIMQEERLFSSAELIIAGRRRRNARYCNFGRRSCLGFRSPPTLWARICWRTSNYALRPCVSVSYNNVAAHSVICTSIRTTGFTNNWLTISTKKSVAGYRTAGSDVTYELSAHAALWLILSF